MPGARLTEFRPRLQNTLRGFADVVLDCGAGVALEVHDLTVHQLGGRTWISWPARPLVDRDGTPLRDEATGKVRYSPPLVRPADRGVALRIEAAVLEAVRRAHPDALGGEGPANG
jgi:hypothetical protein